MKHADVVNARAELVEMELIRDSGSVGRTAVASRPSYGRPSLRMS